MAPLAKLPVFLDLHGKQAVVVGSSAAAAWKAELLAAAGASVAVFAEAEPHEQLVRLAAGGVGPGQVTLVRRPFTPATLQGAAVAVMDARSEPEAQAFRAAAQAAGVPVNVIDLPAFCDFQFGAIVNRSPVVVGISTDGAAPILGQAIRRRIETILPLALSRWAAAAKRLREQVGERLGHPALRRRFWERFVDLAFTAGGSQTVEAQLAAILDRPQQMPDMGQVILVGAGPGDAELLTLKAVRALQSADVILYDDLVSAEILELGRREAERVLVGKRGGRASCQQDEINALLVRLARAGKRVVRLKSGDPMVFGRAGEEIARLRAAGVPVEVVPGITAGLAMAAALGVSLTHRDVAHSVRFVTGHGRHGALPEDLDWAGLADPETTLIVYMGGRTAGLLAARLMAAGLAPDTPACAAAALSQPDETRWSGFLGDLGPAVAEVGLEQPLLIGIGHVFAGLGVPPYSHAGRGEVPPITATSHLAMATSS
jgi:uroporphyrin-III C-methyltransferase/precorrin-2 dehydrogenase/sirohydrochlorin ferrochelatase